MRSHFVLPLVIVSLLAAPGASAGVRLNEVLYDPPGSDGGLEFVEIIGDSAAPLAGWVLETGNGARPGAWTVAWVGGAGDHLRDGLFLVGEIAVMPVPDAVADLDLQNGPDACRLRGPAGELDVLGWGEPLGPEYFETAPAPDVSGVALARLPDGFDSQDNASDFRSATPTPGEFNAPDSALAVEAFFAPPGNLPSGTAWEFVWSLRNVGRRAVAPTVRVRCDVHPGETLATATAPLPLPSGHVVSLAVTVAPAAGVHLPASDPPGSDDSIPWRGVGSDVLVSEALTRPASGEPEWIELVSVATRRLDLSAFRLEDASGTGASLGGVVEPGERVVATGDSASMRRRWSVPAAVSLFELAPWPSLNHTASGGDPAERLTLSVRGVTVASASLPGAPEVSVAWEMITRYHDPSDPRSWALSLDRSGGTPGRRNSRDGDRVLPPFRGSLTVHPSPFHPARDGTIVVSLRGRSPAGECRLAIFDSAGLPVAELLPWLAGEEHRALWDGRRDTGEPAPLGLYLVRGRLGGGRPQHASFVLDR